MRPLIFLTVLLFASPALAQCSGGTCHPVRNTAKKTVSVLVKRADPVVARERTVTVEATSYGFRHAGERRLWWLRRVR